MTQLVGNTEATTRVVNNPGYSEFLPGEAFTLDNKGKSHERPAS